MSAISRHEESDRGLFDGIADDYVKKDLAPAARIARRHRLLQSLRAAGVTDGAILLEAGCGAGFSVEYLTGRYRSYYGVDYSDRLIAYAKGRHDGPDTRFFVSNISDFIPPQPIDAIFMIGVLHHLEDIPRSLRTLYGMLKPGGLLIANEPHPGNPIVSAARWIRKRLDPAYSSDQRELAAAALERLLGDAGFEAVRTIPQGIFSTPFAEVIINPQRLVAPIVRLACRMDTVIERLPRRLVLPLSWNVVAVGRRPQGPQPM